jgi:adenylosuccinate lyase
MPHKRNPVLTENLTGLARIVRAYALPAMENVALWHERDISHSSAERVVLPDASIALHYMLVKFRSLVENLVVDTERMRQNLDGTQGLVFSQAVLLTLVEGGMSRDEAYRIVQRNAMRAWDGGGTMQGLLGADDEAGLSPDDLTACFDLGAIDDSISPVFERLERVRLDQPDQTAAN